jgi:ankyrin repeat protein
LINEEEIEALVREHPGILRIHWGFYYRDTPLHFACRRNLSARLIKLFAQHCPEALTMTERGGRTPLHVAITNRDISYEAIETLIETYPQGARITDPYGRTILHIACISMQVKVIRLLVKTFPEAARIKTDEGDTPLHILCFYRGADTQVEAVELLLDGFTEVLTMTNDSKSTPVHIACSQGAPVQVVQLLLDRCSKALYIVDEEGNSPLHTSCERGAAVENNIRLLMEREPRLLRLVNKEGRTALHIACNSNVSAKTLCIMIRHWPVACLLLGNFDNDDSDDESIEQMLLPYDHTGSLEEPTWDDVDLMADATNETVCALMECALDSRGTMPPTVVNHLRETIETAISDFQVSNSGVALADSIRPHLEPDLVRELVDNNELQDLLKEDRDLQSLICGLVNMNKSGRNYFQEDPSDKLKGVWVLESASCNVDCIFLHLQENYSLCEGNIFPEF